MILKIIFYIMKKIGSIEWKFDTLDTKESNPNVVNKKDDK